MNNYKFLVYNALIPLLLVSFFLYGCTSVSPLNTPAINENLTPPSDIKALADINTIAFEWKLPSDPTIAGYHIYRKKPQDEDFQKIASINTRFSTHYTDTKLEPDTEYLYQFTSYDTHENRSPFSPVIFTKTHILEPVEYIEAIGNYPRMIKLIWNPHPDFRTIGYIIEKKDKNGKWKELTKIKNRLLVEFLDKNLQDNVTHEYRIFAYNTNETLSPASKLAIATTKPKPTAITMFEASTNLPRKITLQWEKHPNPEVTHYLLLRSSILGFSKLKTLDSSITEYTDIIDKDGTIYEYKIIAIDKDGIESIDSQIVTGSTLAPPESPTVTYAKVENNSVVLRWIPKDDRAKEYIVYKKTSLLGEILRYNKVLTPEFIDKEITPGQRYKYSISTLDANGIESKPSNEITLTAPK